jgi:hypothetical protein
MLCKLTLAVRLLHFLRRIRKLLMKITTREREQLREILVALTEGNQGWLEQNAIEVSQQDPFWILNYQQSPRTYHIARPNSVWGTISNFEIRNSAWRLASHFANSPQ